MNEEILEGNKLIAEFMVKNVVWNTLYKNWQILTIT